MPALFVIAIILFVLAAAAFAVSRFLPKATLDSYRDEIHPRRWAAGVAIALAVLGLVFALFSSVYTVPTRNVGIVTSFNKPTGEVTGAGLKLVAPWQKVEDWDASRQSWDHLGNEGAKDNRCIDVRITGMDTACVEVLVEWQTRVDNASEQWASYRKDFDYFVEKRVAPNLKDALAAAFRSHDPTSTVDAKTAAITPVSMNTFKEPLKTEIGARIGADVEVLNVTFGQVHYSKATQDTINAFRAKVMEARNLEQDEKNADARKRITDTNSKVDAVTRCLEIAAQHGREPGLCLGGGQPVQVTNK